MLVETVTLAVKVLALLGAGLGYMMLHNVNGRGSHQRRTPPGP